MNPRLRLLPIVLSLLGLLAAPAAAPAAWAETYDLFIHTYCPTDPNGLICGRWHTEQAYQQYLYDAFQEVNLQWEVAGISFWPHPLPVEANPTYEAATCGGPTAVNFDDWRINVASKRPYAISLLLNYAPLGEGRTCCSQLPINTAPSYELYGFLCDTARSVRDLGSILAHELGHHFCLCHSFGWNGSTKSPMDSADYTSNDGMLDWDGDNEWLCQVGDTPPDPREFEPWPVDPNGMPWPPPVTGPDEDINGNLLEGHQWCEFQTVGGPLAVDAGSPHKTYCDGGCFQTRLGVPDDFPIDPSVPPGAPYQAMSYWGTTCRGPFVINGQRYEAFSSDPATGSVKRIHDCLSTYRQGGTSDLIDICSFYQGDTDHDGVCDFQDNCPNRKNTAQRDADHDGVGDACDLTVKDPNLTVDIDLDGLGALVDADNDGDGCPDISDQHIDKAYIPIGTKYEPGCGFGVDVVYRFEGIDSDGDGQRDCEDLDDDNDGICDEGGPFPPGSPGVPSGGCVADPTGEDICPVDAGDICHSLGGICPPTWKVCQGSSCDPYYLQVTSIVNPADYRSFFDSFRIVNDTIFIPPLPGRTLSETARVLNGDFAAQPGPIMIGSTAPASSSPSGGNPLALGDPVQLEIRSRLDGQLVAVVAQFDSGDATIGDVTRGTFLGISPDAQPGPIMVGASFALGLHPEDPPMQDADGDTFPDAVDNCVLVANPFQADADGDGFGNACDADMDGDLVVTSADVAAVQACEGADLTLQSPTLEPDWLQGSAAAPPNPCGGFGPCPAYSLAQLCGAADLDENGIVDSADTLQADRNLGGIPGPSANGIPIDLCPGVNCDDADPLTEDRCVPSTGQCYHVPVDCDDSDVCTIDTFDPASGECIHSAITCDDGNECTTQTCDPFDGCVAVPVADGSMCDDGDACTTIDECLAGQCQGIAPVICNDGDPCTVDACEPSSGQCIVAGATCDDGNSCTIDSCEGRTGACSYASEPDGTMCDDADACTLGDSCQAGSCAPASTVSCGDADLCTDDVCDPATGLCSNPAVVCNDGDACTTDTCDPASGRCLQDPVGFNEVAPLQFLNRIKMIWPATPGAAHWNTYRGTIPPNLMGSRPAGAEYDHVCFESADMGGNGPNRSIEYGNPAVGWAWYYLVTEEHGCGEGNAGVSSALVVRPLTSACPTPP